MANSPNKNPSGCASFLYVILGLNVIWYGGIILIGILIAAYEAITSPFLSINDRKIKCVEVKDIEISRSIYGCADLDAAIEYDLKGEAACIGYFSRVTGVKAQPVQKYSTGADTVNRIWAYNVNNKPAWSLIECRRDPGIKNNLATETNDSSLLQWRKVSYKGDKLIHQTHWSAGNARVYYSHSEASCIGKSIPECELLIVRKENSESTPVISDPPIRERPPVLSKEADLEQRAYDEINKFKNWSGDGPAPQPIRAMEDLWRCNKYGDC